MILYKKEDLLKVKEDLLNSKIVAFPTDTVFGLACQIDDEVAKEKVYEAKNRPANKKLPMMVSSVEMLERYCMIDDNTRKLFKAFTPGPITLICKYKNSDETVAIRIPNDKFILDLINEINKPLLVTSANISNMGSLIKASDVINELDGRVDGIVNEDARGEVASTIVDCLNNYKILREGPILESQIKEVLEKEIR